MKGRPNTSIKRTNGRSGFEHQGSAAEMDAFDQLPEGLRYAVNHAPDIMSVPEVLRAWKNHHARGGTEFEMLIKMHHSCLKYYKRSFADRP